MRIIGREKEQDILENCMNSGRPEFIAVYGRRRVGKTSADAASGRPI